MFHRSFKPAKCKTALRLAVARIKLLKSKREAQVKQLKRELAQLLESGQDQTAKIRVEHVVREEKTMAAYELIEIYCELIEARMPLIESQKKCPIDLKEAISSVIFATLKCSDVPELVDVKTHIVSKYGKEFVSAAVELRPDCGVNCLLVEKLFAKAPDGPTKIKILTAIAEEHNIKWEPESVFDIYKTALKFIVSQIKLLKNKREAQVKQRKRELAKLLESGQDRTARIRVEHVVREEKTVAAYELIEIYCELIAAHLPMIESQKNCPVYLKEAMSSVIFATPRCSDIPELMDVEKHIGSKYGKEFVSAAVELRPDCGVNLLLVEKLSAKAPDGPTKIKILTAIAEEHNIKWEPKSFGENDVKSSQDSWVGPITFEKAAYVEPSQVHVPPVHDEKGPLNSRSTSQLKLIHDASANSYEQNAGGASRKASGNQSTSSGMSDLEIRSSGDGSQERDFRDSYSENSSAIPAGRQNWNMEFKDAASAAQAAAESAEHASMAAREAAELSNHENIIRQFSSGSHSPSGSVSRDEVPKEYAFHDDKHLSTGSVYSTFSRSSSGMHNEQITAGEQDNLVGAPNEYYRNSHQNVVKHAESASLTSGGAFGDDKPFTDGSQMADVYQYNNLFKQENSDLHKMSIKKQASRTEEDFVTELHGDGDLNTENNYHLGHARTDKQSRKASSSHLTVPSDDHNDNLNLNDWMMGNKGGEDLFVTEVNTQTNTMETSSYNNIHAVFDDSGSEDDDYKFDAR